VSYDGDDRRRWHIKKEVSLGDIIAFVVAAVALAGAYATLDKRLALLEQAVVVQHVVDARQDEESLRFQQRVNEALSEANRKLDRLIERRL
jgi:hypothetical protein